MVENAPGDSPYYAPEEYWPLRHAFIDRMRDVFGEAEVVVVFRRQMDYAQSLYQEHVKVTGYKDNFKDFRSSHWFHFVFAEQAEAWNARFPGLKAISFDTLLACGDAVGSFCRLMDIPAEDLDRLPPSNEGMAADLVVMKRMLHRVVEDRDGLRADLERLEARLPEDLAAFFKRRSLFPSAAEARKFQKSFTADNERLRPFLIPQPPEDQPVFSVIPKPDRAYGDRIMPPVLNALMQMSLKSHG